MLKKILRKNRFTANLLEIYFFSRENLKPKGWFSSRYLHQSIDKNNNPLPWFTYCSIHFITQKLSLKPMSVFEFGSGNSTIWLSSKVKEIVSIENDKGFYSKMKNQLDTLKNVTYEYGAIEGNYSSKILEYENGFDIIIIDGRDRINCTKNAIKALKKDGVIIFDNSDRDRYKEAYDLLAENKFKKIDFNGIGPIGIYDWQTTIYYREENCFEI